MLCHSFKGCDLPPSLLFHALFLSPIQAHNVTSTIFWRDNQKIVGLGTKYCIISNPSRYSGLHLPCFLQHVQHQHLPVNPLGLATGTQCLLEVHQLASLQRQLGFQGQCLPLWELALQAIWTQTLTILLLKLQIYPWIKSLLHFYETFDWLPLTDLFLSQLLTPIIRTLPLVGNIALPSILLKYLNVPNRAR